MTDIVYNLEPDLETVTLGKSDPPWDTPAGCVRQQAHAKIALNSSTTQTFLQHKHLHGRHRLQSGTRSWA